MSGYTACCCMVIAVLVLGVTCMDDEMAELLQMLRENCADESGVDLGLVEKVNAGTELMPDPKLKCYIKCTMETAGMMSDGAVDVEATIALLPDEWRIKLEKILRTCGSPKGADECDTAFLTQVCWQKGLAALVSSQNFEDPTHFFKSLVDDSDVRLRGGLHVSLCVKRLMNCWEIMKADIICTDRPSYFESGCMLMRNKRCFDSKRFGGYVGNLYHAFAMYEEKCQESNEYKYIQ